MVSRRSFLRAATATSSLALFPNIGQAEDATDRFPIGACDWSLGHKQDLAAFETAQAIGLEGLQVSFSTPGSDWDLREAKVREQYYAKVEETGIQLASLGMGILNQRPYSSDPEAETWVSEVIDTIATMRKENPSQAPSVCLLAFFGKGDINGKPDLMESVIQRLKKVMPKAEAEGVVFGIESLLSGEDHLRILDAVKSPNLQVYYDSANSARMGYDIYQEVQDLGGERICQVHCKENDRKLLGKGGVDFVKWRDALLAANYRDWLIIEGSQPKGSPIEEAYQANFSFLDQTFRA